MAERPLLSRVELNENDRRRVERLRRDVASIKATPATIDDYAYLAGRLEVIAEDLLRIIDGEDRSDG